MSEEPPSASMSHSDFDILSWNVRGLNMAARCLAVHETIAANTCHIACLQETKLQHIDDGLARFLGAYKLSCFAYKPSVGTKGGILILWNDVVVDLSNTSIRWFSVSAIVQLRRQASDSFLLSTVYGPSRARGKEAFLQYLRRLKPLTETKWLILGDFNIIYRARDKNNSNLNLQLMRRFRAAINHCQLK